LKWNQGYKDQSGNDVQQRQTGFFRERLVKARKLRRWILRRIRQGRHATDYRSRANHTQEDHANPHCAI
jgi:hypothetical protein